MRTFFQWRYRPDHNPLSDAQAIVGMSFGANLKRSDQDPGLSNEAIAENIVNLWKMKPLPVIAQREIAEAMEKLELGIAPSHIISEMGGQTHITSYDVLLEAWHYCRRHEIRHIVIVAHQAHILRCAWVAERIGFKVKLPKLSLQIPYEPNSTQWWTRSKLAFFIWELRARIAWSLKGLI